MDKEFKDIVEKSTKAIKTLEEKVEDIADELGEDVVELWAEMKKSFSGIDEKLKTASKDMEQKSDEANLQAHLGAMEAKEKIHGMKDGLEELTQKISQNAETTIDTAALKAHLAKMEAEDFWESRGKEITNDFNSSKDKIGELTIEAVTEIKDYFEKLVDTLSDKKS
jgi:uncharacterized phage infection (PIP) family protein YhgE